MKILKRILLVIAVIIAIPLIVAVFVKKSYDVAREITIDRPIEEVFDYVVLLKNQDEFSVWAKMDPEMKKSFKGEDGTVGFVSAWQSESDDVGHGEQEILAIQKNKQIDYELRFIKPFESTSSATMLFEKVNENATKVTWQFTGNISYPMNLMLVLTDFNEMIGKDLQDGLGNLKDILETP